MKCCLLFLLFISITLATEETEETPDETSDDTYDYIVVGGGTAGCILAGRLLTFGTVALIEAGDVPPEITVTTRVYSELIGTQEDWFYKTVPQPNLNNQVANISAGKMLGGTGSLNSLIYIRGNKKDYDSWAADGLDYWRYDDVLPHILIIEDSHLTGDYIKENLHHKGGPISITNEGKGKNISDKILSAFGQIGYPQSDPSDGEQNGADYSPMNYYEGKRQSTYRKYIEIPSQKENLNIITKAFVKKINFDGTTATGVTYSNENGEDITIKASREVIISAGAIRTPQLLMLSGIGPQSELEKNGISVVKDLKGVGQNLQDHFCVYQAGLVDIQQQNIDGSVVGFANSDETKKKEKHPNLELVLYLLKVDGTSLGIPAVTLLRPKSRGTVKLATTNPQDSPLIDPNYLSEEDDLTAIVSGLKKMDTLLDKLDVTDTGYMKLPRNISYCELGGVVYKSDDYWKCVAKLIGTSCQHVVGTCKMGKENDEMAVVDNKLRVFGVQNLRIADGSVMPTIVSANTQVTIMMIAEKAVNFIYGDALNKGYVTTADPIEQ